MKIIFPRLLKDNIVNASQASRLGNLGRCFVLGSKDSKKAFKNIEKFLLPFQVKKVQQVFEQQHLWEFSTENGPVWVLKCASNAKRSMVVPVLSSIAQDRNRAGELMKLIENSKIENMNLGFWGCDDKQIVSVLVGFGMAHYRFKSKNQKGPFLHIEKEGAVCSKDLIARAEGLSYGVNLARHFVNLPPNELNPTSMSVAVKELFSKSSKFKVDIWDHKKLQQEKMGLHLCVGQGSDHPSRLVMLKFRPRGSKGAPIALVGKGITFDTGGLDIKPSKGMRLMKKDMGGAAALIGLAGFLENSRLNIPVDIYLALAENSVDSKSFRPSDIVVARNGLSVEIDNTDAEGRLVLADSLSLATEALGKDRPRAVINVATLTGAGKIALGRDLAGLYSNDDALAQALQNAGGQSGDGVWVMPLYRKYWESMKSTFADMLNSSEDPYGSAITAALFLEKFLISPAPPWAHLDIYAWQDRPEGALQEKGGSGQSVLCLAQYLENLN